MGSLPLVPPGKPEQGGSYPEISAPPITASPATVYEMYAHGALGTLHHGVGVGGSQTHFRDEETEAQNLAHWSSPSRGQVLAVNSGLSFACAASFLLWTSQVHENHSFQPLCLRLAVAVDSSFPGQAVASSPKVLSSGTDTVLGSQAVSAYPCPPAAS